MTVRWVILACAALVASTQAAGAETPQVVQAMDAYFAKPRSPGTFRALAGLGDPLYASYPYFYDDPDWQDDAFHKDLDLNFGKNCRTDYTRKIYDQRLKQFGREHPYFRQWLSAQKAVFANCRSWEKTPFTDLPRPLALDDPQLRQMQQDDRAYQHASALFYSGQVAVARAQYASIPRRSPHFEAAQFMLTAMDAGSQPDWYSSKVKENALPQAEALLRNPRRKDVQAYAHELIGWIAANADTPKTREAQVRVTIEALEQPIDVLKSDPQAMARYRRANEDIGALHGDFDDPDWWLRAGPPPGYYGSAATMKAALTHHIAAWALIPSPPERISLYDERSRSRPLVSDEGRAFLQKMVDSRADGRAWELLSRELSTTYDPAVWTEIDEGVARLEARPNEQDAALVPLLLQHQVASALASWTWDNDPPRIRRVVDELAAYPFKQSTHYGVIANDALKRLMRAGRIREARELRDRAIESIDRSYDVNGTLVLLLAEDDDHIARSITKYGLQDSPLLNRLPAMKLAELATNSRLDGQERARLARAAWTRLYALGRPIPRQLDDLMRSLNSKITASWESKSGAQRGDRALLLDVLRSPAMNILATSRTDSGSYGEEAADTAIDVYLHSTNNWWCALKRDHAASAADTEVEGAFGDAPFSELEPMLQASAVWMAFDPKEAAALGQLDSAPKQLSEAAIAWVEHPGLFGRRKGQDEALAFAVRSTRYGCQMQGGHGSYSKRAFELLHTLFPGSEAAKRTKYWFDCKHFTYGCTNSSKDDQTYYPIEEEQPTEAASAKGTEVLPHAL